MISDTCHVPRVTMVHRPLCPGPLRLMCLRMVAQAVYSYLESK